MKHQKTSQPSSMPLCSHPSAGGAIDTATLDLLAKWKQEDATGNPEDVREAERELNEFKEALNQSRGRSGETVLFP